MALKAPPEEQALLLELQALDTRLQQLAHKEATLPETAQLTQSALERQALQRTVAERLGAYEDAQAELARVESDVAVVQARIARDRERLLSSASPKDAQALEHELASLDKRKSDLEDIQLAVMEALEAREAQLGSAREELAELDRRAQELRRSRDGALRELVSQREATTAARRELASRIGADLLALYERQRERYGVGASHLQHGISSASGFALNATDMAALRAAAPDDVILCPDSSAILVRTAESGL